jgi:hypothetical protein
MMIYGKVEVQLNLLLLLGIQPPIHKTEMAPKEHDLQICSQGDFSVDQILNPQTDILTEKPFVIH